MSVELITGYAGEAHINGERCLLCDGGKRNADVLHAANRPRRNRQHRPQGNDCFLIDWQCHGYNEHCEQVGKDCPDIRHLQEQRADIGKQHGQMHVQRRHVRHWLSSTAPSDASGNDVHIRGQRRRSCRHVLRRHERKRVAEAHLRRKRDIPSQHGVRHPRHVHGGLIKERP